MSFVSLCGTKILTQIVKIIYHKDTKGMNKEGKKENLLLSWKEIAAYLDCNVRTCLRWEKKHGLPVHRVDEKSRATVFAYKEELDDWLVQITKDKSVRQEFFFRKFIINKDYLFLLPIAAAAVILIFLSFFGPGTSEMLADFKIDGSKLIILNEEGEELWRYETGIENLVDGEAYRSQYQFKRMEGDGYLLPQIMIKDINQDRKSDVLFSVQTQDDFGEGDLLCFNHKGKLLWTYAVGRELKFGSKVYSADYRIYGFDARDLDGDGRFEIIILSAQIPFFPSQLIVLDAGGQKLGDYWNSGRLADFAFIDLDQDGRKEIVTVGCNNEYGKGCLIAFDLKLIRGCSPQSDDYRCRELGAGTEKYYVLFPRSDVDMCMTPVDSISMAKILKNGNLYCRSGHSALIYELNHNLEPVDVRFSHKFEQKHKELLMDGKIDSRLDEEYRQNLHQGFLYYDGEKWVPEPTLNRNWWK